MTLEITISAAIIAALISGFVAWLTSMATIKAQAARLKREFQLDFATEAAIKALLAEGGYEMRSFDKIRHHLPGFDNENELRRTLIRAGAISFKKGDGTELWGMLEKHRDKAFK